MKNITGLIVFMSCLILSSCIPHKDTIYLQNKEHSINDSISNVAIKQSPYRVQIADILSINVKALDQNTVKIFNSSGAEASNSNSGENSYFNGFTIDLHGNINMPIIGELNVLGLTTKEIEKIITAKLLKEQFKETAHIFVKVKLAGLRFTANGEVGSPGSKTIFRDRVNIFEAIANSGEIPITGNKKDVLIIRQHPEGQRIHHLDLTDLNVMTSPFYYIQPNDLIYVKPLKQKSIGTGETAVSSITTIATVVSLITSAILIFTRLN